MPAHYTVPGWSMLLIELFLDECSYILLNSEFLQSLDEELLLSLLLKLLLCHLPNSD